MKRMPALQESNVWHLKQIILMEFVLFQLIYTVNTVNMSLINICYIVLTDPLPSTRSRNLKCNQKQRKKKCRLRKSCVISAERWTIHTICINLWYCTIKQNFIRKNVLLTSWGWISVLFRCAEHDIQREEWRKWRHTFIDCGFAVL